MKFIFGLLIAFSAITASAREASLIEGQLLKQSLFDEISADQVTLSYKEARIKLFNDLYLEKDEKGYYNLCVYCQTKFYREESDSLPSDIIPNHNVFNTEHTWPQSKFNRSFNKEMQKSDLHHLFPTFNKINAERGNNPFADVERPSNRRIFCDASKLGAPKDAEGLYFEPPAEHKGNVARAIFYFSIRYDMPIDPVQEMFLKVWHLADPVDEMEELRHDKIVSIQRNRNPFIDEPRLVMKVSDF